ncbi:hypothetical protein TcYC6_0019560 [Trypanosoma cruzi]|uniref:DUF218 domain-containing protein n=1 Tax=Trypanosoma cruzi TaxID=5693 RepID=A0A7J6Y1D7_TRYCR|nr:hypothetical protein ECC02_006535 [Trypanosoma cruzi]KAF8279302.1 hypothetical protein TcYC6_0019560 [Trypanosoma cruzi]
MKIRLHKSRFLLSLIALIYVICFATMWYDDSESEVVNQILHKPSYFNPMYRHTDTLIMIPCHGVLRSLNAYDWQNQSLWEFEKHQLRDGVTLPFCLASHIRRALQILKERFDSSILIFSGGQTKVSAGPRSEALSYYLVAEETNLFGLFNSSVQIRNALERRIFTEEFARDSLENLLFSIARFYEITGHFPESIIVVGWKHKKERFLKYHRQALRYPAENFFYIGLAFEDAAPFVRDLEPYRLALPYNDAIALSYVSKDMYLCTAGKETKNKRNPQFRYPPYGITCPPLLPLLRHCGPHLIDRSLVPWK